MQRIGEISKLRSYHLSSGYFGDGIEILERHVDGKTVRVKWDWGDFKDTKSFPVDGSLINWVIGQDQALNECFLCLDEWVHKLTYLEKTKWYDGWSSPKEHKPSVKNVVSPGPYLLLLGPPRVIVPRSG